jgi:hypothetical protein
MVVQIPRGGREESEVGWRQGFEGGDLEAGIWIQEAEIN